jgi:putative mycofactocin binding protein MftB
MKLAKFVKFREEKFGGVLFETRSEKVFTLNPTATAVVREIQAGTPEADIATRVTAAFEGSEGDIRREVGDFLADLRGKGLVES